MIFAKVAFRTFAVLIFREVRVVPPENALFHTLQPNLQANQVPQNTSFQIISNSHPISISRIGVRSRQASGEYRNSNNQRVASDGRRIAYWEDMSLGTRDRNGFYSVDSSGRITLDLNNRFPTQTKVPDNLAIWTGIFYDFAGAAFPDSLTKVTMPANMHDENLRGLGNTNFVNFYKDQNKAAGTYVLNGPIWSRQ